MKWEVAVRKRMGSAAQGFELDVRFASEATRLVLFGPSGAGKSLTLKAIAGLLRPDAGHIAIDGERLFDASAAIEAPTRRRRLGHVFQEYALFPHLTVRQNVAFGLDTGWRNPARHRRNEATEHWLESFELQSLGDRFPDQLSGGQRQRTALARALAAGPRALLLDEPFAALDADLRARLRAELVELQARLAFPVLLITHDIADVRALADDIVHLEGGRVVGAPGRSSAPVSARS